MKRFALATLMALSPSFAASAPLGSFSEAFFFGDSFTDGGAAFDLAGESGVPSAIYPNGQLTNGDVWATKLGATYVNGTYTALAGFGTTNFAVGGAEAVAESDDDSPDLGQQIGAFLGYVGLGRVVPPDSLGLILMGGNDIGEAASRVDPTTVDPADLGDAVRDAAREIGSEVINAIVGGTAALLNGGISKVAVFGLPDLGIFPSVIGDGLSSIASAYTPEYNANLQTALAASFTPEQVVFVDTFAIFDTILSDPGAYGIINTTESCIESPACLFGDPNTYFFYDSVHPTEVVHQALADAVQQQFAAPIPLPAGAVLLITGFGGLILVRRRHRGPRT